MQGEGVAPKNLLASDWYPRGTKGPPYSNDSRELVKIEVSIG